MPKNSTHEHTGTASEIRFKRKRVDQSHPTASKPINSSRNGQYTTDTDELASPANPKRPKLDSTFSQSVPIQATAMYSFKSNKVNRNSGRVAPSGDVIDLTGASPPRLLKVTRQPVISLPTKADTKIIKITNLRRTKPNVQAYYDQTLQKLEHALSLILANEQLAYSNEDLYKSVENICRQGRAAGLYRRLKQILEEHANKVVKERLLDEVTPESTDAQVLVYILREWQVWKTRSSYVRDIFYYLERTYLLEQSTKFEDASKDIFNKQILSHEKLQSRALDGVCDLIASARQGETLDRNTLKDAVRMFADLGLYSTTLEPKILDRSQTYFDEWATKHSSEDFLAEYITSLLALLSTEAERCDAIGLTTFTKTSLTESMELLIINGQSDYLSTKSELWMLLDENKTTYLEQLYSLLGRCNKCELLIKPFETWITDRGTKIVFCNGSEEGTMVVRLLALKRQIDALWIESFHRNKEFAQHLRSAFHTFMNLSKKSEANYGTGNTKQGEMIAKYVNMILEGGSKTIPSSLLKVSTAEATAEEDDNETQDEVQVINEQLDQVLDLFRFLDGKAVFEAFYKKDLARRLLLNRSASADAELSMITRLKNECGAGFTQNIETMFKDMELSKEEMGEYISRQDNANIKSKVDLNVHVLSSAAWPSYPDINFNVPVEVRDALSRFETSYRGAHQSRKLFWKYGSHHSTLTARFPLGTKELVVSAFQAAVLLMFNKAGDKPVAYDAIQAQTGLRK